MFAQVKLFIGAAALAAVAARSCSEYNNCADCLHPDVGLDCGWCSPKPAQWAGGAPATQCMDHTSKGWDCFHLYMHDGCVAGYVCNQTAGKCELGAPGTGDTKENCEKSCSPIPDPPKRFSCNTTTFTCAEDPLGDEKATCDTSCSNSTPAELVGIWRGLYVQQNFTKGEWELNFSTTTAAWGPHGTPTKYQARVASLAPRKVQLTMTAPADLAGTVLYASHTNPGWPTGPQTRALSLAVMRPGAHQVPPADVARAMGHADFDVFVFHECNSWKSDGCNFLPAFGANLTYRPLGRALASPARARAAPASAVDRFGLPTFLSRDFAQLLAPVSRVGAADPCAVHSDCGSCIDDPLKVCGWCDGIINYGDGTTCGQDGNGCCGGASGFAQCNVAYRKECPVTCDWSNWTAPVCRYATTPEKKDPDVQKFKDCAQVEEYHACEPPVFGQYCNETALECVDVKSKEECEKTPGCDPDSPVCGGNCSSPAPPSPPMYNYCDPTAPGPAGSGGCKGPINETECRANPMCDVTNPTCSPTVCKAINYYTCSQAPDFQCHEGTGTPPPGSFNSSDDCTKVCYDSHVGGVWRGLRIDDGFVVDEWDFSFNGTTTPPAVAYKSVKTGVKYTGTYSIGEVVEADFDWASFEIVITLATGETLSGLYNNKDEGPITRFMYLGLPLASGDTAVSYADAMQATKQEFVLIKCKPSVSGCDFGPAMP